MEIVCLSQLSMLLLLPANSDATNRIGARSKFY